MGVSIQPIEGFGELSKQLFLLSEDVDHELRHCATHELHILSHGRDGLRQELIRTANIVQYVADDRHIQSAINLGKELRVIGPFDFCRGNPGFSVCALVRDACIGDEFFDGE
jgi:hypothetical protein